MNISETNTSDGKVQKTLIIKFKRCTCNKSDKDTKYDENIKDTKYDENIK